MSALNNSLLLGQEGGGGYAISRSVRLNSADSAYFSRTPASAGNRKTWTWAGWVKRSLAGTHVLFFGGPSDSTLTRILFNTEDLEVQSYDSSSLNIDLKTSAVYRDFSAWLHCVVSVDTTQATSSNRAKVYVNGTQITAFATATYPSQNYDTHINTTNKHSIGVEDSSAIYYKYDGLLADIHFCDGTAYDASAFGEFDANGIWQPKKFAGVYGSQGWHLDFADNSTAAALGTDAAGSNDWTVNNISVLGNGSYVKDVYTSDPTYNASATDKDFYRGPLLGFDGSTSTSTVGKLIPQSWLYFRPNSSLTSVAQLRVYASYVGEIRVNGSVATLSPAASTTAQWYEVSSPPSTVTEIAVKGSSSGSAAATFNAIEVNGIILVDLCNPGNDSLVDVPTNGSEVDTGAGGEVRGNYCTWNPLVAFVSANRVLANGNLDNSTSTGGSSAYGTFAIPSSGKWYFEVTANNASYIGIDNRPEAGSGGPYVHYNPTGVYQTASGTTSYGASYTTGDVIGVAVNVDGAQVTFYKNGSSQGAISFATAGITGKTVWPLNYTESSSVASANFGQRPFAYTAPSGFKALCTANLPAPVVTKPSTVFDTYLWSGNGGTQTISTSFSPDFVWVKQRDNTNVASHVLVDIVRGNNNVLRTNGTDAENSAAIDPALYDGVTNLSTASFDVVKGSSGTYNGTNGSGKSYAGWCWDAGSSTVTNTQGSISSQVRANPSAGFSIVTYTGNGNSSATIGHGLGVTPQFVIFKNRSSAIDWIIYHVSTGTSGYFNFDTAAVRTNIANFFTGISSTTIPVNGSYASVNGNGSTYVAYCFAPVAGYSAFGSYTGNGSADGPFVFTGMRPRWILFKKSSGTENWRLHDTARSTYNAAQSLLFPNLSNAETTSSEYAVDILSNGFKIRTNVAGSLNDSGATYIYAAFAESPFQYARAR